MYIRKLYRFLITRTYSHINEPSSFVSVKSSMNNKIDDCHHRSRRRRLRDGVGAAPSVVSRNQFRLGYCSAKAAHLLNRRVGHRAAGKFKLCIYGSGGWNVGGGGGSCIYRYVPRCAWSCSAYIRQRAYMVWTKWGQCGISCKTEVVKEKYICLNIYVCYRLSVTKVSRRLPLSSSVYFGVRDACQVRSVCKYDNVSVEYQFRATALNNERGALYHRAGEKDKTRPEKITLVIDRVAWRAQNCVVIEIGKDARLQVKRRFFCSGKFVFVIGSTLARLVVPFNGVDMFAKPKRADREVSA